MARDPNRTVVPATRGAKAIWHRLTGSYYSGDGRRNRHDDIYTGARARLDT